jgi:hypothetical protein
MKNLLMHLYVHIEMSVKAQQLTSFTMVSNWFEILSLQRGFMTGLASFTPMVV